MSTGGDSGGDDSLGDGRKGGKRELSQSKRAAQNRAAQVSVVLPLARYLPRILHHEVGLKLEKRTQAA